MEKIDKAIEILQAFKEGKTIKVYSKNTNEFLGKASLELTPHYEFDFSGEYYEILKEPTYRPYTNADEFLKASKEHGPYIKKITTKECYVASPINDEQLSTDSGETYFTYFCLHATYTWADGSVCGILEQ